MKVILKLGSSGVAPASGVAPVDGSAWAKNLNLFWNFKLIKKLGRGDTLSRGAKIPWVNAKISAGEGGYAWGRLPGIKSLIYQFMDGW